MGTVDVLLQSTHVKWVFIASSVAFLGTEHTNKVFLVYNMKDRMTDRQVPHQRSVTSS